MKPSYIFGLLVRVLGLYFLYRALITVPEILPGILSGSLGPILEILLAVGWPLLVAYFLLFKAAALVQFSYPNADDEE